METVSCGDPEGGQGVRTPLKNNTNIGFLSNTGPDTRKIIKLPIQHLMLGHHRLASQTPFKWRFAGVQMMVHFYWYIDPPSLII